MSGLWQLFLLFLKVNLLTTSGPASVGLLYKEAVGKILTESQFIEAVGFSSALPGSDALQLAMFVGYSAKGVPGALVALIASILPPTILMLGLVSILRRFSGEAWLGRFMRGLSPAVAVLMVLVAWNVFYDGPKSLNWITIIITVLSGAALMLDLPAPLVLLAAGLAGVILFK